MTDIYDVTVVGAGAAGLTAAREAARTGARVLLLERMGAGGQVSTVEGIGNFPGRPEPVAGYELGVELLEEAESVGVEVRLAQVESLIPADDGYLLRDGDGETRTRAVIIAAGSTRRALGVPGEAELEGHGVSHCASCDGPFFRGKTVVVVGGGDSAFDEARLLAEHAGRVIILHSGPAPTARREVLAGALAHDNVEVHANTTVAAIRGTGAVDAIVVRDLDTADETVWPTDGVFVYVGLEPNTAWLAGLLDREPSGRLSVGDDLATSQPGVFAAGDIRSDSAAMLSESVSDGIRAARAAVAYVTQVAGGSTTTAA